MGAQINEAAFFERHTVKFERSKEQEWQALEQKLRKSKMRPKLVRFYSVGVAATVLLCFTLALKFSNKTYKTEKGEQKVCILPDGSTVNLNAETQLNYNRLNWYISREVNLQGEAFFEVEKGSKFTIFSDAGNTQVLGTSFNIYARNDAYKVSCVTGKVQVNTQGRNFRITPGKSVIWNPQKRSLRETPKEQENLLAWQQGRLRFKATVLRNVFDELERQYNVYIAYYSGQQEYEYSGNLSLKNTIEENLNIICKPFDIKWEKSDRKDKKLYIIK